MPPEDDKAIVRRLIEDLFNTGNPDIADEVLADDYVDHSPSHPDVRTSSSRCRSGSLPSQIPSA